jgi:hypothetical protein
MREMQTTGTPGTKLHVLPGRPKDERLIACHELQGAGNGREERDYRLPGFLKRLIATSSTRASSEYITVPTCKTPATISNITGRPAQKPSIVFNAQLIGTVGKIDVSALQDSGAEGSLIHPRTVSQHRLSTQNLPSPIPVLNIDGTPNVNGPITHETQQTLRLTTTMREHHDKQISLLVTNTSNHDLILGTDWLAKHNPSINWQTMQVDLDRCPKECGTPIFNVNAQTPPRSTVEEINDTGDHPHATTIQHTLLTGKTGDTLRINAVHLPIEHTSDPLNTDGNPISAEWVYNGLRIARIIPNLDTYSLKPGDTILYSNDYTDDTIEDTTPLAGPLWGTHRQHFKGTHDNWDATDTLILLSHLPLYHPHAIHVRAGSTRSQQLAEAAAGKHEPKSLDKLVPEQYRDFHKVFDKTASERLPNHGPWDHAIDLKPDFKPKPCKLYPLSPMEQTKLDRFLAEQLTKGYIRPSKSPMTSPFFFVKKKDGQLRPVQDYQRLNARTVKNAYPLPLINELVDKLRDATIFSKVDIRWGYPNIHIKHDHKWKAAFRTNRGLFEPLVMFFGLTNSPATFQAMMNERFKELIKEGTVLRYVTRKPNLRVKGSCTGLGNLEVFLFVSIVSKDYVLGWTLFVLLYDWSDVT